MDWIQFYSLFLLLSTVGCLVYNFVYQFSKKMYFRYYIQHFKPQTVQENGNEYFCRSHNFWWLVDNFVYKFTMKIYFENFQNRSYIFAFINFFIALDIAGKILNHRPCKKTAMSNSIWKLIGISVDNHVWKWT